MNLLWFSKHEYMAEPTDSVREEKRYEFNTYILQVYDFMSSFIRITCVYNMPIQDSQRHEILCM